MARYFATGFEPGSLYIVPDADADYCSISSTSPHTGTYALYLNSLGVFDQPVFKIDVSGESLTSIYVAAWILPNNAYNTNQQLRIKCELGDGKLVELRLAYTYWDAYVDGSKVADGSLSLPGGTQWHHLQVYFNIANSGNIQSKVDGRLDINYSGDTLPASDDSISKIHFHSPWEDANAYIDDVELANDWPGDVRFDVLIPDGDDSVAWTPSSGSDNYALVDEVPPDDADYVSASANGWEDRYTLSDWDATNKDAQYVVQWVRAKKATAASSNEITMRLTSGSETSDATCGLFTAWDYYHRIVATDPDGGGDWDDTALDGLKAGQVSVM